MTRESVLAWLRKTPFEPFELVLSNGDRYAVRHPENAIMLLANIIVTQPGTDRYAELALLHIAGVERSTTSEPVSG